MCDIYYHIECAHKSDFYKSWHFLVGRNSVERCLSLIKEEKNDPHNDGLLFRIVKKTEEILSIPEGDEINEQ
jgi:hypothetical protein